MSGARLTTKGMITAFDGGLSLVTRGMLPSATDINVTTPIIILRGNQPPHVRPSPGQPLPHALIDFFKKV